ncbi:MAG TPA: Ig-like domain-containing protein [Opitutaceae bacterium]|nr:Ig-like domain-containing protein [Opitutaceae bacterium]
MKFISRLFLGLLSLSTLHLSLFAQSQPVVAVRINQVSVSTGPGYVSAIEVQNSGREYVSAPKVTISEGGGTGATAIATIQDGGVIAIEIINRGTGYTTAPKVTLLGGGGTGASARAEVAFPGTTFNNPNEAHGPAGFPVTISALATGTFPASGYVYNFFINGTPVGTSINNAGNPSIPGMIGWIPPAPGAYFFTVTASNGTSGVVTSLPVRYFATGAVITSPQSPTLVPVGSSVVVKGEATTAQGFVRQMEFFVDGVSLGVDNTAPYSVIYTPPSTTGTRTLTAVATDNDGRTLATDIPVMIYSVNPIGSLPVVSLASPLNSTALRIPDYVANSNAFIPIDVVASDSDGTITKVETYVDGVLLGTDQQFPYTFEWRPQAIGTFKIVSLAFDDKNNVVASAPSQVIISAPPTVTITQPSDTSTLPAGAPANITASASDSDGSVISVQFFADDVLIGDDTTAPYSVSWTPLQTSEGKVVELTALATDNFGITRVSSVINVRITGSGSSGGNIGEPPVAQFTSPAMNATYTIGQPVTLAVQASDPDGVIQTVQFFANGKSLGSDSTYPYSLTWSPTSLGNYAIQAKALDDKGNVTTVETAVTIIANSRGLPEVSLVSPVATSNVTVHAPVYLAASAIDSDGVVASVDFLVNNEVVGSTSQFPYVAYWQPPAPGDYTIQAVVVDDGGNRVVSAPRTITARAAVGGVPLGAIYFNNPGLGAAAATAAAPSLTPVKVGYGSKLILGAVAVDEEEAVASIAFYLNGRLVDTVRSEPYTTTVVLDTLQKAVITGVVTDQSGNVSYVMPIVIDTQPQVGARSLKVELSSPMAGGSYSVGSTIIFAASHNAGDVPQPAVDFYLNGHIWYTVSSAPYSYNASLTQPGEYEVRAVLRTGNVTTVSEPAKITVTAGTPPRVSLTSPTHGSTITMGGSVTLTADASDADGTIASVQFYANGSTIGTPDLTAPYTVTFVPPSEGIYRFTALATDSSSQSTVSTERTILVVNAASRVSSNPVYSGTYFAGSESGKITLIKTGADSALAIAHSATGTPKVYFYQNLAIDAADGFSVTSSAGAPAASGRFSDTGASGTFDSGRASFIAPVTFSNTSSSLPSGLYSGNVTGRLSSSLVGILGPDGVLTVLLGDGSNQEAGSGPVNASGAFSIGLSSGGRIAGTLSFSTRFITATVTGGSFAGSVTAAASTGATISDGTLRNLSTRGAVGAGDRNLIAGFIVGGSSPKKVLVRAVGPSLSQFGLSGVIANPELTLYRGNTVVERNDNWGGNAAIAAASSAVGAFALNANSLDAAITTTLAPGAYTASVSGVSGSTGVALVEVYDVDNIDPFTPQKVLNLSTRGEVGTGERVLIAGFVVNGSAPKKLLIRAVGPSLASFGVAGVLADPVLRILQGTAVVRENDNWETGNTSAIVSEASVKAGAFALPSGSKDAAILLTLPPGTYTAQVTGVANSTGVALVEVYEIP